MSEIQSGIQAISREPANAPIVKRFFRFAAAVAFVPVVTYVLVFNIAKTALRRGVISGQGITAPPILGGIAAIFSLNIVTSLFALLAVQEKSSALPQPVHIEDVAEASEEEVVDSDRPKTE